MFTYLISNNNNSLTMHDNNNNNTSNNNSTQYGYPSNTAINHAFGIHYNALFVLITISNTRSKRVNENITRQCTRQEKNVYMQIFMFVNFVVIEMRLFNRKKKQKNKKKMKNMATLL